jgi:DNA mismatch repair protein MutL
LPIQLLSPQLANQIAAGEVVERPASVVKELVENSLDAGATRIEVDIEKGGHKRIRIKDDGGGIAKDELTLALSRHATSKITTLDDLEQILSLGFRGEALASISSVSRLTLTSRTQDQKEAWQAYCEGREMAVSVKPAAHPVGTTIDVADLFYNTPARRKFLRTEKTEFQHIEEVIKRIALSHPKTSFVLKHNDKIVKRFIADKNGSMNTRISGVLGQKFVDNAIHVNTLYDGITIDAWLGNEVMLRSSNDCQFSFVNGRGMRDKLIMHAIRQAYESVWGVVEQPAFVVYLTINPKDVDVNVHPAKHEVRFQQSRLVHDFICKTVCDALSDVTAASSDANPEGANSYGVFDASPATHDYIRPLTPPPASSSPTRSARSSTGAYHTQSTSPSGAYNANFTALMTPNADTGNDKNRVSDIESSFFSLSSLLRLYKRDKNIFLLCASKLAGSWLNSLFLNAENAQPLLMPVAIAIDKVSDERIARLTEHNFVINKVAGKVRLQQVPAGTRHLPWVKWFEKLLLETQYDDDSVLTNLAVDKCDVDENLSAHIWHWLDQQSEVKQWEYVEQFARVRTIDALFDFWGTNDR